MDSNKNSDNKGRYGDSRRSFISSCAAFGACIALSTMTALGAASKSLDLKIINMPLVNAESVKIEQINTTQYDLPPFMEAMYPPGYELSDEALTSDTISVMNINTGNWQENHWPDHAIDGNYKTYWSDNSDLASLELELSHPMDLSALDIAFKYSDSIAYTFRIDVSENGDDWHRVAMATSKTGIRGLQSFELKPGIIAQKLRIVGFGNSKDECIRIQDVRINGNPMRYNVIQLGSWEMPENIRSFDFGPLKPLAIWGADMRRPVYFKEWLPALFERTLVLDEMDLDDGQLSWIFTGQHGGLTLHISETHLEIVDRHYDSPGYLQMEQFSSGSTSHPEWISDREVYRYSGKLESVTIRRDHKLGLSVLMNGKIIAESINLLIFNRHQLNLTGEDPYLTGRMLSPQKKRVNLFIDQEKSHQTIIGFGGITSMPAYHELSTKGQQKWWRMLAEYNLLVHREYPIGLMLNEHMDNWDDLQDARPHYYADNFPNGEISDFEYLKKVRQLGGIIVFEFWELPPWISKERWLQPDEVDRYAEAIVRYCELVKRHTGSPPEIVGIQNEISQKMDIWYDMIVTLRSKLDGAGFKSVKIHMPDDGFLHSGIERVKGFRQSEEAWEALDYSAVHMYDYQDHFTNPDAYDTLLHTWRELVEGKPLLSHEISFHRKKWQSPEYTIAFSLGQLYHKNLVLANAAVLGHCWNLLTVEQPSYGWTRSLMVSDRDKGFIPVASSNLLRVFGSFSRRIHKGMQRISVVHDHENLLASAYYDDSGRSTLVALNRGTQALILHIDWPGAQFKVMEITDPYHANRVIECSDLKRDHMELRIDPGAIITISNVELNQIGME